MKTRIFNILILISAIPFGANLLWSQQLMTVSVAIMGLVHFSGLSLSQSSLLGRIKLPVICFLMVLVWAVFQIIPWGPDSWRHPFYQLSETALNQHVDAFVSLWPDATLTGLLNLLTYGLIFLISFQIHASSRQSQSTLKTILLAGTLYAFYGLFSYFQSSHLILWFDCLSYCDVVHSTFINRNSYATFAGLSLLAGLPALLHGIQNANRYGLSTKYGRQYFIEKFLISQWQTLLWLALITTALMLTESRGGFLSTALAIGVFFSVLQLSHKIKGHKLVLLSVFVVMLLLIFGQSGDNLIERLDDINLLNNDRLQVYDLVEGASSQNPWFGVGLGSFEKSFRLFRDESIVSYFDKAHNTYLELIFEIGYVQAALLCGSVLLLTLICTRGVWIRQRDWIYPAVGLSATVLVATHALVDFSLQIPAVSYLYALILGLSVAQSYSRSRK